MRVERDSMGEMPVPDSALYGASTQRAVLNFPISGHRMPEGFIRGLAFGDSRYNILFARGLTNGTDRG